jgi:hypothetical protein
VIVQVCPNCLSTVELPATAAGTTVDCPKCKEPFPVPDTYTPTVAGEPKPVPPPAPAPVSMALPPMPYTPPAGEGPKPAPPPGFVPPGERPAAAPGAAASPSHAGGATYLLSPVALDWLPVACFTLVFVLTFFSWVGLYPGGYKAYAQTPWHALAGTMEVNPLSEQVLQIEGPLKALLGMNVVLLLPYFLCLFWAVILGWADRAIKLENLKGLPGPLAKLERLWPYRSTILAGLAVATLLLLLAQVSVGFGLENATEKLVNGEFKDRLAAAKGNTSDTQKLEVEQGMQLGKYTLQTTTALTLAVLLHVTAVVAAGLRFWLHRRGAKPLPRVTFWS